MTLGERIKSYGDERERDGFIEGTLFGVFLGSGLTSIVLLLLSK